MPGTMTGKRMPAWFSLTIKKRGNAVSNISKVRSVDLLACDAGWRNYHFVKITTEDGIVGWSEFDEGFGSPGVGAAIQRLSARVVGQNAHQHERIYAELFAATRPAAGGVVAQALGAIENALLDAKAKRLGVPCYELLGGKIRDRIRVYWSHCATWRINHPDWYKPPITDLDGVKAIGREVREKKFTALKSNIFTYDAGRPRGWRPGFGAPLHHDERPFQRGGAEFADHGDRYRPAAVGSRAFHPRAGDRERSSDHARAARLGHRAQRTGASRSSAQGQCRPFELWSEGLSGSPRTQVADSDLQPRHGSTGGER